MKTIKTLTPGLVTASAIALLVGLWLGYLSSQNQASTQPPSIQGTVLPEAKVISSFNLIDHNKQAFGNAQLIGHWSLIFMGYTHCPDVCPTTLTVLQHTVRQLRDRKQLIPQVIFVSVDSARDTPESLSTYVKYYDESFVGVSGEKSELDKLANSLAVYYAKSAGSSGDITRDDYLMDHTAALMLINPEGKLQAYLTPPHSPEKIIDSIVATTNFYTP